MLDAYSECKAEREIYAQKYAEWTKLKNSLKETEDNAKILAEQKEFLTFQKNELEKASLRLGEEAELEAKTSAAAKSEAKMRAVQSLRNMFDGENGLMAEFQTFQTKVRQFASVLPETDEWEIGRAHV